jgi:hypothetical protein
MEPAADFDAVVQRERAISPALNGRTVFDGERSERERKPRPQQTSLWDLPDFPGNKPGNAGPA